MGECVTFLQMHLIIGSDYVAETSSCGVILNRILWLLQIMPETATILNIVAQYKTDENLSQL